MAERFEAFVIKVADKDDSRRVIGRIMGKRVAVPTEKLWELIEQDAFARSAEIGRASCRERV